MQIMKGGQDQDEAAKENSAPAIGDHDCTLTPFWKWQHDFGRSKRIFHNV